MSDKTARNFEPLNEVTMYQARCTNCGLVEDDYGDFSAWSDPGTPIDSVVDAHGWLGIWKRDGSSRELHELLCPGCQTCAVCGKTPCYPHDDGEHAVCEEHEDHDFSAVPA